MNSTLEIQDKLERAGFWKSKHTTKNLYPGYLLLAISFALFVLCDNSILKIGNNEFILFFLHYFLALAYTVLLLMDRAVGVSKSWKKENISRTVILLNLFLISAYALNRTIPVFENSVDWLCGYLIISSLTIISFHYTNKFPGWLIRIQQFTLGSTILLYAYLAIFAAHFYPVSTVGILFFGIGAHIFVPLFLLVACTFLIVHNKKDRQQYYWIAGGFTATIILTIIYITTWNTRVNKIQTMSNQSVMSADAELPVWVKIGQSLPNDWLTQRILKSKLVYTVPQDNFLEWPFLPSGYSWDEARKHDPLVFLASMKSRCTLPSEECIKILQILSHGRHAANERLWSGENLTTSYIVSDIDIYTDLHLAYTEKYLNIKNNVGQRGFRNNSEEAIYTFQLPEGSVVTSLSLWINGKEEKAILTSKQKATLAYKTIVGVESRDPSVVHWQEGNTVTVRVFPCTSNEERKFKIGITSPLIEANGQTMYKTISFNGPDASDATETTRLRFIGPANGMKLSHALQKDKKGYLVTEQKYDPEFSVAFQSTPVNPTNQFTFDGFRYSIAPAAPVYQPLDVTTIYLDINNQWTQHELQQAKKLSEKYDVIVYSEDEFIKLTPENWDVTEILQNQNFSLFPFHLLHTPEHALVITKGEPLSPHMRDFKDSKFAVNIQHFFASGKKIHTFNLGTEVSGYVRSLREFRAFDFAQGNFADLSGLLKNHRYPVLVEDENTIALHDARLIISKTRLDNSTGKSNAPDHLARLFAYNDIMRKVGSHYFTDDFSNADLIDEASKAYVVSPVSSLIVLETQEDYKRFDINAQDNSLSNASKQSSGAVPEPHEWALIALFAVFILYVSVGSRA